MIDNTSEVDNRSTDFAPIARISLANWAIIISLIVALVGWGITTQANTTALEKKADKDTVEAQLKAIAEDLQEIKADVREIRSNQDRVRIQLIEKEALDSRSKDDRVVITNAR